MLRKAVITGFSLLVMPLMTATAAPATPVAPTVIDPAAYQAAVTHPLFPLATVTQRVYEGEEIDADTGETVKTRVEEELLGETTVVAGVEVSVVEVMEYNNGELIERTLDYYAQGLDGAVYYFGEDVDKYAEASQSQDDAVNADGTPAAGGAENAGGTSAADGAANVNGDENEVDSENANGAENASDDESNNGDENADDAENGNGDENTDDTENGNGDENANDSENDNGDENADDAENDDGDENANDSENGGDENANGAVVSHEGTWRAGEGGAMPGLFMPAAPRVGDVFEQERAPGIAEDISTVVEVDLALTTPAGDFTGCIKTEDVNPLDVETEFKTYCHGVGLVREEAEGILLELASYATASQDTPTATG